VHGNQQPATLTKDGLNTRIKPDTSPSLYQHLAHSTVVHATTWGYSVRLHCTALLSPLSPVLPRPTLEAHTYIHTYIHTKNYIHSPRLKTDAGPHQVGGEKEGFLPGPIPSTTSLHTLFFSPPLVPILRAMYALCARSTFPPALHVRYTCAVQCCAGIKKQPRIPTSLARISPSRSPPPPTKKRPKSKPRSFELNSAGTQRLVWKGGGQTRTLDDEMGQR
jgi:hypothetical protein